MTKLISILTFLIFPFICSSQTSDDQYKMSLVDVLTEIQQRYGVSIRYNDELVTDKYVTYAQWRYRPDVDVTLKNVLTPVDLFAQKEGENKYKLKTFQYHRIPVEQGKEITEYLASKYKNQEEWEKRKKELRSCMWNALQLNGIPQWPASAPIISNFRKHKDYTVENIALEVIPGVYTFGSIYKPSKSKTKSPIILCPNGHWTDGRYHPNHQTRCALLASIGAVVVSYDLIAWGESGLQFPYEVHHKSLAMTMQVLNTFRFLDYLSGLENVDTSRIAISGGSGGGSHTMLITALDDRIKVSSPAVMLSCYMYGGCPCESGMPVHLCGEGTNNVEIASMAAPRPQLIISDGGDWTDHVPEIEYPAVKRIYGFYGQEEKVENIHLSKEGHDFGTSKRMALYPFMAKHLDLDIDKVTDKNGEIDESRVKVEPIEEMYVIGNKKENLPKGAVTSYKELEDIFNEYINVKK